MTPDDPRHGTTRGYHAGCRCLGCSLAMRRYWKLLRVNAERGQTLRVPGRTVRRRVEALFRLGWTADEIAAEAGWQNRNDVVRLRTVQWVERKTFHTIAAAYERMCMSLPPEDGRYRTRQRNHARRNGWLPPLAWDDIDNDPEPPAHEDHDGIDEVLVDRILGGEWRLRSTPAEKAEVTRRWVASGRSLRSLRMASGWKVERYYTKEETAA